jgi:SAM-dependent methyltransferase
MIDDLERLGTKWTRGHGGDAWRRGRWGTRRRAQRDPRAVAGLLAAQLARPGRVLDVACGTGRLRAAIEELGHLWIGCDASADQLGAASGARVRASAERLPFLDRSFDAVVACRFLHHLEADRTLAEVVSELVRVSRGPIVASFWDRDTWPFLLRRTDEASNTETARRDDSGRVARSSARIEQVFAAAGAPVVRVARPVWRLSAQTFVVARRAHTEET